MNQIQYSYYYLREYFFPQNCGICRSYLLTKKEAFFGLCNNCREKIIFLYEPRCSSCGRPLISEINQCLTCRISAETEPLILDKMISIFPYTGIYIQLLSAFKYEKSLGTGNFLAEQIIKAIELFPDEKINDFTLIPVPPRPGKIRKSGWDQILALSNLIAQRYDSPGIVPCLERKVSQTQKKLDRNDRKINLKGRIVANKKPPQNCILFDDVITTGSTMNACAHALKQAGAEKIYGICLFYD